MTWLLARASRQSAIPPRVGRRFIPIVSRPFEGSRVKFSGSISHAAGPAAASCEQSHDPAFPEGVRSAAERRALLDGRMPPFGGDGGVNTTSVGESEFEFPAVERETAGGLDPCGAAVLAFLNPERELGCPQVGVYVQYLPCSLPFEGAYTPKYMELETLNDNSDLQSSLQVKNPRYFGTPYLRGSLDFSVNCAVQQVDPPRPH